MIMPADHEIKAIIEMIFGNVLDFNSYIFIKIIGMGMMSQSGVAEKMFTTLASKMINILAISTSEIKISVLIQKKYTDLAIKSLHKVYKIDN